MQCEVVAEPSVTQVMPTGLVSLLGLMDASSLAHLLPAAFAWTAMDCFQALAYNCMQLRKWWDPEAHVA